MTTWGSADFEQLRKLKERLQKAENGEFDAFCRACSKELAARLLKLVIPRTPVGVYPTETGKTGGTLRRGWTAGKDAGAESYAQSLPIEKTGSTYTIEVLNPVEYASYVEFGHRTRNGGSVEPRYFMTVSEKELDQITPKALDRKLEKYLKEVFRAT